MNEAFRCSEMNLFFDRETESAHEVAEFVVEAMTVCYGTRFVKTESPGIRIDILVIGTHIQYIGYDHVVAS